MAVLDQRRMCGAEIHESPEQVQEFWLDVAARRRARLEISSASVPAYVNQGRWVADCPECSGGIAAWPEHAQGACLDCLVVYQIEYPDAEEIERAEEALDARKPVQRNWRPWTETPGNLLLENIAVGR